MDNLWALTLKRERHKVGSKTKAIEKSDEMLDMEPWKRQAENIWDHNLNIYGINLLREDSVPYSGKRMAATDQITHT